MLLRKQLSHTNVINTCVEHMYIWIFKRSNSHYTNAIDVSRTVIHTCREYISGIRRSCNASISCGGSWKCVVCFISYVQYLHNTCKSIIWILFDNSTKCVISPVATLYDSIQEFLGWKEIGEHAVKDRENWID